MKKREAPIDRKTKETAITGKLIIDGGGKTDIKIKVGFLKHMLDLFVFWGHFDLNLNVEGDLEVDQHHTNEDVGICLGKAFKKALGDCTGINRMGSAEVPMDEAQAKVVIDISGRYAFSKKIFTEVQSASTAWLKEEGYSFNDGMDFIDSFAKNLNANIHVDISSGDDLHHILEAVFKAFGKALDQATQIDPRRKEVPSTKGII
ncbi:MAG: imidazoleglycerol-phosphate dehydratase [Candidatus Omnitrophica bacterium]|nr:imidazoleglycerol-phosphate dehydratase [Candidatus Omnitrophota bacterium]MBU4487615.1 imidazoleglycerol-phosphate dehydratase [Candidatus Omnitrophota bacterium]MCG2705052.1 imidazoleglycerol-phosphate dehydratase [Candidatus Omnitrophota bacterium]